MVPGKYVKTVKEARALREHLWPEVRVSHGCLYEACCLQLLLARRHGVRTMLQAGSCSWPMILPEEDDGVRATHFSYQWEPLSGATITHLMSGTLPELHVWLASRELGDILIDPTTGSWPDRAAAGGHNWSAPAPPACLWGNGDQIRKLSEDAGYVIGYEASLDACQIADTYAANGIYGPLFDYAREHLT